MRTLFLYSLLCVGVTALLLCWPVALVVLGGVFVGAWGWWMAGGVLLFVILFFTTRLVEPYMRRVNATGGDADPIGAALRTLIGIGVLAFIVAAITAGVAGPQLYHHYEGERTTAVVTETESAQWTDGTDEWRRGTKYRVVDDATGEDLGWVERGPTEAVARGARFEVSVDPRGYVNPVATERMGWTKVPTTIIVVCYAVTALAALFALATALLMWPYAS
ncbi:hypothetical protein [Streptomyces sp. 6N223]|uniref:hypothetical protein n=1 Tax=Streptomyces sp. 6N223 TaxID=3457412 RepID=UPI003FD04EE2